MYYYKVTLRLGGNTMNEVQKIVSAPEFLVLRFVHGPDALTDVTEIKNDPDSCIFTLYRPWWFTGNFVPGRHPDHGMRRAFRRIAGPGPASGLRSKIPKVHRAVPGPPGRRTPALRAQLRNHHGPMLIVIAPKTSRLRTKRLLNRQGASKTRATGNYPMFGRLPRIDLD